MDDVVPHQLAQAPDRAASAAAPSIFALLPAALRARVCESGRTRRLAAGSVVIRRGEPCRALSIVLEGTLMVGQLDERGFSPVTYLWPNDVFGTHASNPDASYPFDIA